MSRSFLSKFRTALRRPVSCCATAFIAASCSAPIDPLEPQPCGPGFATQVASLLYGAGAGFGQSRMPGIVLGPPNGAGTQAGSLDVVSLGLEGHVVLSFAADGIADGPGPDFIVFENAFYAGGDSSKPFREPATISVSDDAQTWTSFPCDVDNAPHEGCAGLRPVLASSENSISPFDVEAAGGDAFDLQDIGVHSARFVRVQSSKQVATANGTSGFDLDAIAVLNPACR